MGGCGVGSPLSGAENLIERLRDSVDNLLEAFRESDEDNWQRSCAANREFQAVMREVAAELARADTKDTSTGGGL